MEKISGTCCIGSRMVISLLVSFVSCIIFFGELEGNVRENRHSRDVFFKALCDEGDDFCLRRLHGREEVICLATLAHVLLGAVILFVRFMNKKMKNLETGSEETRSQQDEGAVTGQIQVKDGEGIRSITHAKVITAVAVV